MSLTRASMVTGVRRPDRRVVACARAFLLRLLVSWSVGRFIGYVVELLFGRVVDRLVGWLLY
eukprot:92987-Alexandrium_andersonii.AAC.1